MRVSVVQAVKYISAFYTSFRKWAFQKVMQFKVEFWKKNIYFESLLAPESQNGLPVIFYYFTWRKQLKYYSKQI